MLMCISTVFVSAASAGTCPGPSCTKYSGSVSLSQTVIANQNYIQQAALGSGSAYSANFGIYQTPANVYISSGQQATVSSTSASSSQATHVYAQGINAQATSYQQSNGQVAIGCTNSGPCPS
jgi:hypothetical protein